MGHEVHVLTRSNNRETIEAWLADHDLPGVQFLYTDLPPLFRRLKKLPGGIYPYTYLWQVAALMTARRAHARERYDRVQHLTFVSIRFPSFLGLLGVPFLLGPVGGGEQSPPRLRGALGTAFSLRERLRSALIFIHRIDPIRNWAMGKATLALATSAESAAALPRALRARTVVHGAIAGDGAEDPGPLPATDGPIDLLYAGLWKDWKGLRIGFRALAQAREKSHRPFRLAVVGRGPQEAVWREEVKRLGLDDVVTFEGWVPRARMLELYAGRHGFLFPSLHDSGGLVVPEAMARGLPVICLGCGGPAVSVGDEAGHVQPVDGLSHDEVVSGLADALVKLGDPEQQAAWRAGALARAERLTWRRQVARAYELFEEKITR